MIIAPEDVPRLLILPPGIRTASASGITTMPTLPEESDILEEGLRFNRMHHRIAYLHNRKTGEYNMWIYPDDASSQIKDLEANGVKVNSDTHGVHYGVLPVEMSERIDYEKYRTGFRDKVDLYFINHLTSLGTDKDSERRVIVLFSSFLAKTSSDDPCFPNMGSIGTEGELTSYSIPNDLLKGA